MVFLYFLILDKIISDRCINTLIYRSFSRVQIFIKCDYDLSNI